MLRERLARLESGEQADPDDEEIAALLALTEDVLQLESAAAEYQERAEHRRSSEVIYLCALVLAVGSAATLAAGLWFGWVSGWGIIGLGAAILAAVILAGAHLIAETDGHRARAVAAVLGLVAGVAIDILAPGWLPWWASLIVLLFLAGVVIRFTTTVQITEPSEQR